MKKTTIAMFGLACLVLIGFIATQYFVIADLKKKTDVRTHERNLARKLLKTREDEIKGLRQRVKNLTEKIIQTEGRLTTFQDAVKKIDDEPADTDKQVDELDRWLGAIGQIKSYLERHPEYAIADMKFLTTKDWFEVTKNGQLQSDADYRKVLAELRLKAKYKTLDAFNKAVNAFSKANNGSRPQNLESIIPYLPQDFDSSIVKRYANYQPGAPYGNFSQNWIIMEAGFVDDIWDGTFFVSDRGGSRVIQPDFANEIIIKDAIAKYKNEYGTIPTDFNQITKYFDNQRAKRLGVDKIDEAKAAQVYKSIMTETPLQ